MKKQAFIFLLLVSSLSFGQKAEIEDLINQISKIEIPENFEHYFLVRKSLEQTEIYDSIQNYQIRELKMFDKQFQPNILYKKFTETTDWKNYELKNMQYVSNEFINPTSPPRSKNVRFVKYNINQKKYDSLFENKKPHTLIVKKKWIWNKNRIWTNKKFYEELLKAWKKDEKENIEQTLFFRFSKPIFSEDKNYARISIWKNKRCNGNGFTALYRKENGIWKKMMEYNQVESVTTSTHSRCEDISITYNE